jgi:hypothetical protein
MLYYLLAGNAAENPHGAGPFIGDLVNFFVPTHVEAIGWWAGHLTRQFPGNDAERGTYIGIPALVMVALFARRRWRTETGRFLLLAFGLGVVATLGSWLTVDGHQVISLPWIHLDSRPLFENLMPVRFSMYTALVTAVIVALWVAGTRPGTWPRVLLPVLAIIALLPNVGLASWAGPNARTLFASAPPAIPRFFTNGAYRHCLRENEVVLALPFGARGNSLIWQAKSGFWFRLAGGYVMNAVPPFFSRPDTARKVADNKEPSKLTLDDVRGFTHAASVTSIVLNGSQSRPWRKLLDPLGQPQVVDGVLIYRLRDSGVPASQVHETTTRCATEAA